jgi:hypothetical protein
MYCGEPVLPERWELGYEYCMSKQCVASALNGSLDGYRLILMPKQGFAIVSSNSPDLKYGKSSGRS